MTALENGIDWGTQVQNTSRTGPNTITYAFAAGGVHYSPSQNPADAALDSVAATQHEMDQFAAAFALYASFLNVTFQKVDAGNSPDFTLVMFSQPANDLLGAMGPPGTSTPGIGVFNVGGFGWDRSGTTGGLDQGGYGFVTIIHELGHGMGLAHPHDNGGGSSIFPGVSGAYDTGSYGLNQGIYTTMSYVDGWHLDPDGLPPDGGAYGFQGMPMAIDIAVLQAKYGAYLSWHTNNNTYVLPNSNGAGTFFSCIWDAGGTDEIDYSGTRSVTIQLRAATLQSAPGGGGFISYAHGVFGGFTIAHGVRIENAASGFGNDFIAGNSFANAIDGGGGGDRLAGGGGSDRLYGRAGADLLNGGPGKDKLFGGQAADKFVFHNALSTTNVDTIADFTHGVDDIELARTVFTTLLQGALPASAFFRGAVAHDVSDRIIYNPGNGALVYDANGSQTGGSHLFAHLSAHLGVTAGDFLVI